MARTEFCRTAFVLVDGSDGAEAAVVLPRDPETGDPRLFCTCSIGSYASCEHAKLLLAATQAMVSRAGGMLPERHLATGPLGRLLPLLARADATPAASPRVAWVAGGATAGRITVAGQTVAVWTGGPDDTARLASRLAKPSENSSRAAALLRAERLVWSEHEQAYAQQGILSSRQTEERSLWSRLLYHCYRELGSAEDLRLCCRIDVNGSGCWLTARSAATNASLSLRVPPNAVPSVVDHLAAEPCASVAFGRDARPREVLIELRPLPPDRVVFTPRLARAGTDGDGHEPFDPCLVFGDRTYVARENALAPLSEGSLNLLAWRWGERREVAASDAARMVEDHLNRLSFGAQSANEPPSLFAGGGDDLGRIVGAPVVRSFDGVQIEPVRWSGHTCHAKVSYSACGVSVPFASILQAKAQGHRLVYQDGALVDCRSIHAGLPGRQRSAVDDGVMRLSHASLLHLRASPVKLTVKGETEPAVRLRSFLDLSPRRPLGRLRSSSLSLRPYQVNGVNWLLFLWDHGLGGLLCDDMGVGKTHQVLGLIAALREQRSCAGPVLVVCPLTVIPHWEQILGRSASSLRLHVYHGEGRSVQALPQVDIVLMPYGLLRADIAGLTSVRFAVAVFDEAQNLKNPGSQVHAAARQIEADMKIGLTGTPVENSVADIKALLDLTVPGYLGGDDDFVRDFLEPIEQAEDRGARDGLRRLIAPFVLRRRKETVLSELPPLVEDIRACELSEEQRALYDDVLANRGAPLLARIRDGAAPVPYMHVFAVLNLLKQICDHPALAAGAPAEFAAHQSGKWDLFKELLDEALGSAQKTVVYSQYLGMVDIIGRHLRTQGIKYVELTGDSTGRGELVRRFNTDPQYRVFVGTLKAGGAGIDLVAASVVIHYDRWWNAAREDQATGRVHRIGQSRSVQVLKLKVLGTVEDRIDELIAARRALAVSLPAEDSPDSVKTFAREDLLRLLGPRQGASRA